MLWLRFGLGKHAVAVVQEDPENVTRFFKTIVANEMLYTTGLACSRLSLVALYYRLFGVSSMRYFLHVFVFIIIAWAISTVSRCLQLRSLTPADLSTYNASISRQSGRAGPSRVSGMAQTRIASIFSNFMSALPSAA